MKMLLRADHIIDIGPGAGIHGGEIAAKGTSKQIIANKHSVTGQFLSGTGAITIPKVRHSGNGKQLQIKVPVPTFNLLICKFQWVFLPVLLVSQGQANLL